MSIKQVIPDEVALLEVITAQWGAFTEELQAEIGVYEVAYQRARRRRRMAFVIAGVTYVVSMLLPLLAEFTDGFVYQVAQFCGSIVPFALVISVLWVVYVLLFDARGRRAIATFHTKVDEHIYPRVLQLLGLQGVSMEVFSLLSTPRPSSNEVDGWWQKVRMLFREKADESRVGMQQEMRDLLAHSELITEPCNTMVMDDIIKATVNTRAVYIAELDLTHVTGSGKHRRVKYIFSGIFVAVDLPQTLTGKTFISTDGDRRGFGHQSFWNAIFDTGVQTTELEWNDFENKLHVASDNPIEARYILSPDFMADVYAWWEQKTANIRISFIENRMYILFPDKNLRIGGGVDSLQTEEVQRYMFTIARPIMHIMHLLEDVQKQVR